MKKLTSYIALYLCLFVVVSCSNPELKSNAHIINTPQVKVDGSEQTAKKLTELFNNENCKEFFNTFPNTFQEFNQLYGYEDGKGGRILFSKYPEHLSYLFDCSEVSEREKLKKAIDIGIDGKWEADTIETFQISAFKLVEDHINEAKKILDNLPDDKAASFWYFLFDGPHPNNEQSAVDSISNLLGKKSNQSKLLLEQFKKIQIDWKEH